MPPAPQSLADLLAEGSGDDLDKMEADRRPASSRGKSSTQPRVAPGFSRRYRSARRPLLAEELPESSR